MIRRFPESDESGYSKSQLKILQEKRSATRRSSTSSASSIVASAPIGIGF